MSNLPSADADREHVGDVDACVRCHSVLPRREALVLTVSEAASMLGISKDLGYELVARGELPALRLGRRLVVPTKALIAMVNGPDEPAT